MILVRVRIELLVMCTCIPLDSSIFKQFSEPFPDKGGVLLYHLRTSFTPRDTPNLAESVTCKCYNYLLEHVFQIQTKHRQELVTSLPLSFLVGICRKC